MINPEVRNLIVYGSPLFLFFILAMVFSTLIGVNVLLSLIIAAVFALIEFAILHFVFSRVYPTE